MLVHDRPGCHRDDGFRSRRAVAQGTVWSLGVVVFPPFFDDDLSFFQGVEDFTVQQFIPQAGVEAFTVSVLPGRSRLDVGRLGANSIDPISDGLGNKFGAEEYLTITVRPQLRHPWAGAIVARLQHRPLCHGRWNCRNRRGTRYGSRTS